MKAEKNPFRSSAIAKLRYRLPHHERLAMVEQICSKRNYIGSIVGPEGTGKTTLLEDLAEDLRQQNWSTHWLQLRRDTPRAERQSLLRCLDSLGARDLACLDGGEVLGPWQWHQLRASARAGTYRIIVTLHQPRKIPILACTQTNWPTVLALLEELLHPAALPSEMERIARTAFNTHSGNVREVFRACYWSCARGEF